MKKKQEIYNLISKRTKEAMNDPKIRNRFLAATRNKSEEWKKHISESLLGREGRKWTDEQKENFRQKRIGKKYGIGNKSRTGYKNSPEMNRKISEGLKKVPHTEEWNRNVSKSLKGKKKSEAHKQALRKPKPKYKWMLPNGEIVIMDASNGSRHEGWVKLEKV